MSPEIKRLLKLSNIPGFKLSVKEQQILDDWKQTQKDVVIPKKVKKVAPEGFKYDEQIGTASGSTLIEISQQKSDEIEQNITPKKIRVKNIVKEQEKETGENEE